MDVDAGGDSSNFPAVVTLNVGGLHFTTSLETLQGNRFGPAAPGAVGCGNVAHGSTSMLSAMFSGRLPTRRDAEGRYFIDRDGRHFHHILNYLRDGKFPAALSLVERLEVAREASFYGLEALSAYLRADLRLQETNSADNDGDQGGGGHFAGPAISAAEAADLVMNRCLEEWPEFSEYVDGVVQRLLSAGGLEPQQGGGHLTAAPQLCGSAVLDEHSALSLQADTLAAVQIELAHATDSKAWRWSDRKTGVNSVLRAKLLRCHLQRLGYTCRIVPVFDKKEVSAYVLQVELPTPC